MEHPHLLPKLEAALQCLYGNNNTVNSNNATAAHEFLMHYKSSNVRRLVASRIQSQKDQGQKIIDEDVNTGSVFLSSLALLLQGTNINNRIFASQTINHRCRSLKIVETLDIEAEDGIECGVLRLVMAWEEIRLERQQQQGDNSAIVDEKSNTILTSWIERYVPMLINRCKSAPNNHTSFCNGAELLSLALERHSSSLLPNNASKDRDKQQEERIKGTLIMLTIAVAMYTSAFAEYEEEHQSQQAQQKRTPWVNAVLCELGSALSITALRIRYKPLQDKYATPNPEPSCLPLIDMLVETIQLVKDSAETFFAQKIEQQNLDNTAQSAIQQAHQHATKRSICGVVKSLPETVLLPPGEDSGHRVPSIDRASLRAASMELRSAENGMEKAWKVLVELDHESSMNELQQDLSVMQLLQCCEAWARYTAVPIPIIESTVGSLAVRYIKSCDHTQHSKQKAQSAAFQYLISIFESASPSLTANDVLTAALGVGAGNAGRSASKKKQSSKSKKRQDKRLGRAMAVTENNQNDGDLASAAAEKELLDRRNAACVAAAYIFGISLIDGSIQETDGLRLAATSESTSTHGICSTVASAATSVLPHLLVLDRSDRGSHHNWRIVLFSTITTIIRRICSIPTRDIRALAYEPLMIFHTSLNSVSVVTLQIEQVAVDEVVSCTLSLAASCGYPQGYFDCLSEDNEEELEIERNDIRDVARSVCSLDSADISMNSPSILILQRIVSACNTAIQEAITSDHLPNETVVHILSSLAKPLNKLGKIYKQQPSDIGSDILIMALQSITNVEEQLNKSLDTRSISELLPLSRLVLMGAASLSPLLSHLVEAMSSSSPAAGDKEKNLFITFQRTISSSLQHAMLSTAKIPELIAESTLKSTRYDIRGAMRGPGGEDHVGAIALLRLSNDSDTLARAMFEIYPSILHDLCNLHQTLKESELRRGVNIDYGDGVCPVSRRMIIKVISHLSLIRMKDNQSSEVQAVLKQLLQAPLIELRTQARAPQSAEHLFRVCEASFDLSSFSPKLVADVFSNNSEDLATIFQCLLAGYARLSFSVDIDDTCHQWARLRGGAYCVMSMSIKESLTDYCASNISALIKAECKAATLQCNQGADSASSMFIGSVIGEEMVDAGVYLMLIRDCLTRIAKKKVLEEKDIIESIRCLSVLKSVVPVIVPLIMHQSPEANNHVDPRPTIAEAYYLTLSSLVSVCRKREKIASCLVNEGLEQLFGESLCLASMLIFLKDLGDKKSSAPDIQTGLSLDAAHTLAMTSFISESLQLGSSILSAGQGISSVIQLTDTFGQSSDILTAAILVASLLRAVSGALPPWSVEETPELFESIFTSICGSSADSFVELLSLACKLRTATTFGGVREGELLAGRYLDVSDSHISSFITQSKEVCSKGNWKKIKVILKSTCGGKKKDSGFNLKPGFTSWEKCDRL